MKNENQVIVDQEKTKVEHPSAWIVRHGKRVSPGARVLDVACGTGRHLRYFFEKDCRVTGIDIDISKVSAIKNTDAILIKHDLEDGNPPPFGENEFDVVVVTRYLHRPLFPAIVSAVAPGGILLYETFAVGHEKFGKPRRPEFLLRSGELREVVRGKLRVIDFEETEIGTTAPARLQRIAAIRES